MNAHTKHHYTDYERNVLKGPRVSSLPLRRWDLSRKFSLLRLLLDSFMQVCSSCYISPHLVCMCLPRHTESPWQSLELQPQPLAGVCSLLTSSFLQAQEARVLEGRGEQRSRRRPWSTAWVSSDPCSSHQGLAAFSLQTLGLCCLSTGHFLISACWDPLATHRPLGLRACSCLFWVALIDFFQPLSLGEVSPPSSAVASPRPSSLTCMCPSVKQTLRGSGSDTSTRRSSISETSHVPSSREDASPAGGADDKVRVLSQGGSHPEWQPSSV